MSNNNYYYLCDFDSKKVIDYIKLPSVWSNITGLNDSDDATVGDLNWAGHNMGFLSKDNALAKGIPQSEIDKANLIGKEYALLDIRKKRQILLDASDKFVMPDRWEGYSSSEKTNIANYRQALRDMTETPEPFNPVWPVIPTELDFLRTIIL